MPSTGLWPSRFYEPCSGLMFAWLSIVLSRVNWKLHESNTYRPLSSAFKFTRGTAQAPSIGNTKEALVPG